VTSALALALALAVPPCSPGQREAAMTPTAVPLHLTCSLTLGPDEVVVRPLVISGAVADGLTLDCGGGALGTPGARVAAARPTVLIRADATGRPADVTLRACRIFGAVRIWGLGAEGDYEALRAASRQPGFTARAQALAPTRIRLEQVTITAEGTIPLYVGPGVTGVELVGSRLDGRSDATAIYLDHESARSRIVNNTIATRTTRELIAIDGSAENRIEDNFLDLNGRPGILLYRNCGERGVIRHQTPSHNRITDNTFTGAPWLWPRLVVENAREGRRSYCGDDAGYPFGSSRNDGDGGRDNLIRDNRRR
jgi:hypothetical protein